MHLQFLDPGAQLPCGLMLLHGAADGPFLFFTEQTFVSSSTFCHHDLMLSGLGTVQEGDTSSEKAGFLSF